MLSRLWNSKFAGDGGGPQAVLEFGTLGEVALAALVGVDAEALALVTASRDSDPDVIEAHVRELELRLSVEFLFDC
jgi:hypothetical protein